MIRRGLGVVVYRGLVMGPGWKRRETVEAKERCVFSTDIFFISMVEGQCQEGMKRKACTEGI